MHAHVHSYTPTRQTQFKKQNMYNADSDIHEKICVDQHNHNPEILVLHINILVWHCVLARVQSHVSRIINSQLKSSQLELIKTKSGRRNSSLTETTHTTFIQQSTKLTQQPVRKWSVTHTNNATKLVKRFLSYISTTGLKLTQKLLQPQKKNLSEDSGYSKQSSRQTLSSQELYRYKLSNGNSY